MTSKIALILLLLSVPVSAETLPIMLEVFESQGISLIVTSFEGQDREISLNAPTCDEPEQCEVFSVGSAPIPFQGMHWNEAEGFLQTTTAPAILHLWESNQSLSLLIKASGETYVASFAGEPIEVTYQDDLPTVLDYCCNDHVHCDRFYEEQCN